MKRKIKISGKKVVSSFLIFIMMCQLVGSNNLMIANAEIEAETDTKSYIIMADNSKEFNDLASRTAYSIVEEDPELSDNNIAVMELSQEEAEALQHYDGLIVEEDITITANSIEGNLGEETITEATEAETTLAESDEESQTGTEETEAIEETEVTEENGNTENPMQEETDFLETEDIETVKKREVLEELLEERNNVNETEVKADWNLQAINTDVINTNARSINKVRVAVLDSGVDYVCGIDLTDSINLVEEEEYVVPMYQDLTGHGTGIASIICANGEGGIKGVNPNVDLYSVKVLDGENKAPLSRIIKGIYWCIDNDVNIINMSFGTSSYSNAMKKAVEDAYDAGILLVGASGNNADKVEYPAAFKEVMAVASTNAEAEISSFSNTGKELDIAAPGEKIQTASFFGGSTVTHGTSIAVPHVVGVASLLWEKDLSKSHEFIRQLLDTTSKNISNSDECGLIDADYAMRMYKTFSENFVDSNAEREERIPENTGNPDTFEEINEDDAYVEGRWTMKVHESFLNGYKLSTNNIKIMKAGIIYPDQKDVSNIYGYGEYPEYHGGYKWKDKSNNIVPVNYVACYEFLTRIAYQGGDTSKFTNYKLVKGLDERVFVKIKSKISSTKFGDQPWSKILAQYGNTATNRKYFLWGSALHLLTDSFAHLTKLKKGDVHGAFISHEKGADNPATCPNRFQVANEAVSRSIGFLTKEAIGNYVDFCWGIQERYNNTFVKINLYKYLKANAGSASKLKEWFDINLLKKASYS